MKTELLVIVSNNEAFFNNEDALINYLHADALLTIKKTKVKKITFLKPDNNTKIHANLNIASKTIFSSKETYLLSKLENDNMHKEVDIEQFNELSSRVKIHSTVYLQRNLIP